MSTDFPFKVKRLRSARHLRLRVIESGEVVVTAPLRLPQRYIDDFVAEHLSWITEKQIAAKSKLIELTEARQTLFFRGQEYSFRLNISSSKKPGVSVEKNLIVVTANNEDHATVRGILEKWYRREAEIRFKARVPLLADLVNVDVRTVSIRSQRTRWCSCSSRNTISLNWRLVMAPDHVSDYVIYHELAHLTHMNHSNRFWQLVADYYPNYKTAERWLKEHQQLLRF